MRVTSHDPVPKSQSRILVFHCLHLVTKHHIKQNILTQNVNNFSVKYNTYTYTYIYIITPGRTPGDGVFRNACLVILQARVLKPLSTCFLSCFSINFTYNFLFTNSILSITRRHSGILFPSSFSLNLF